MSGKAFSATPEGPNSVLGHEATPPYRVLSLFSGAGGMDLGFTGGFTYLGQRYERLPFQIVRAYDIDPRAVATYNANLDPVCQVADITTLEPEDLPQGIDVVLGGFPCQDFSFAGKRQGLTVHRGRLYLAMVRVIEAVTPKVFVAENVKGLLSANGGLAKEIITRDFANAGPGYRIYMGVLNAADYGVPQRRERVFIVGVRKDLKGEFSFPEPTHHKSGGGPLIALPTWRTIEEALGDIEDPEAHARLPNAEWDKRRRYPNWRMDRPVNPSTPAPTVLTKQPPFHYKHERRLSVRECARLQSFPDTFTFLAPMSDAYRLVGNAVPPVLAWHLATATLRLIRATSPPSITNKEALLPWVTAKDALADLEDEATLRSMPNHEWSKVRKNHGQGNRPLKPGEPAPTIHAEHHGNIEFHYSLPRRISVREAARLQSFPDDFVFHATMSGAYRLVGNAVPPVLAWHIARSVARFLTQNRDT